MTTNKEKLNELLTYTLENINDDNRASALDFIKKFIIPGLVKEEIKGNIVQAEPVELEEPEQTSLMFLPDEKQISEKSENSSDVPKDSKNGHKVAKKRKLEEDEKDYIRDQFRALNGIIHEDACLENLESKRRVVACAAVLMPAEMIAQVHQHPAYKLAPFIQIRQIIPERTQQSIAVLLQSAVIGCKLCGKPSGGNAVKFQEFIHLISPC